MRLVAGTPIVALGMLVHAACVVPQPTPHACVGGFQSGQVLTVRLGAIYDAASAYYYDGSLKPTVYPPSTSCGSRDGLATGAVVSFTLQWLDGPSGNPPLCAAWLSQFAPESVTAPHLVISDQVPLVQEVTIAEAFAAGTIGTQQALASRGLFTPAMHLDGGATPRQLPPLVVSRTLELDWQSGAGTFCYDAWVATWETAP